MNDRSRSRKIAALSGRGAGAGVALARVRIEEPLAQAARAWASPRPARRPRYRRSPAPGSSARGGISSIASSLPAARMLVSFFSLIGLTSRSEPRAFSPMIMPHRPCRRDRRTASRAPGDTTARKHRLAVLGGDQRAVAASLDRALPRRHSQGTAGSSRRCRACRSGTRRDSRSARARDAEGQPHLAAARGPHVAQLAAAAAIFSTTTPA